ncbi:SDR family oxidoreductase [Candidatus Cyanaurora vandensis]|uniref:SDR family oxidoreductase n=1 Tax=Candidatus Cyanaurora vandensis TaxID=2714958 RepID=UPI002579E294|nr:SDR family oxidoreductase [Candidatus Cyanaurora vandensis]
MQLKPINEQVAVIVGASSGIGRETARQFAQGGAKVVVAARTQSALDSLVDEIKTAGGEAVAVVCDVSEFDQVKEVAQQTLQVYGRMDTWVHAAAIGMFAPFAEISPEEFKRVMDVNLMGQAHGLWAALPHLKHGGSFISVSSVEGRRALPLQSPYSASKHALEGLLESVRVELAHSGSPVNLTSILPATINTPFYNKARTKLGVKPTGVPPYYQPSVVAEAILHAAQHPHRELIVGDVGRVLDGMQKLSPSLVDSLLVAIGFVGQRTNEPKPESVPDGLFEPIEGYDRAEGDYGNLTIPSVLEVLDRQPIAKALTGAALGAVALFLVARAARSIDA